MIRQPAYFTGFSSRNDGSASLRFATQELTAEDFALLKEGLNSFGFLLFKSNEIKADDIPVEDVEDTKKTPSKRLRNALYVFWKQLGGKGDFETYYREKMELFITQVKSKLD